MERGAWLGYSPQGCEGLDLTGQLTFSHPESYTWTTLQQQKTWLKNETKDLNTHFSKGYTNVLTSTWKKCSKTLLELYKSKL